ncbi:MAG: AI-2E family transporter [Halobacteria archaeon]|nr:AI-2E family transporter [Halobacteria archaeon]
MEYTKDLRRRLVYGLVGLVLLLVVLYILNAFIATITFAVFLYYSTRPIYKRLRRYDMPRQIRAMLTIFLFALPFMLLLMYTVILVVTEILNFVGQNSDLINQYILNYVDQKTLEAIYNFSIDDLRELNFQQIREMLEGIFGSSNIQQLILDAWDRLSGLLSLFFAVLFQVFIMLAITYYMLTDGRRLKEWFLRNFDETGILRRYARVVDSELSDILFGNILNLFLTSIIGIIVYHIYNFFAPPVVEVPFPALVGALTGIGSLIPIVGMKVVYYPVAIIMALSAVISGQITALAYVVVFVLVSSVVVDLIPDFVLRPYVSGKTTHMGLLMFAYIFGPLVFGFYGIFLAPILLVLTINFVRIILPYILEGEEKVSFHVIPREQSTLKEFSEDEVKKGRREKWRGFLNRVWGRIFG